MSRAGPAPPESPPDSWAFLAAAVAIALAIMGTCLAIATQHWFSLDDLGFLSHVQRPRWSFWYELLPLDATRYHWAYRPLSAQLYFRLGVAAFGLNAVPYYAANILTLGFWGLVVVRLGRQLQLPRPMAILAGLLAISRTPSLAHILWGSMFQYLLPVMLSTATVSLFLSYLRSEQVRYQVGACLALVGALLSHEMGSTLPAVLFVVALHAEGFRLSWRQIGSCLWQVAPSLVIVIPYLYFRFALLPEVHKPSFYDPILVWRHLLAIMEAHTVYAFGHGRFLLVALTLMGSVWALLARRAAGRALLRTWLAPLSLLCVAWALAALAPFAPVRVPSSRFALPAVTPLALLFAAHLAGLWQLYGDRRGRLLELLALGSVVVTFPYAVVRDLAENPAGRDTLRFAEFMRAEAPVLTRGSAVVLLYGDDGLVDRAQAEHFIMQSRGSGLVGAIYGGAGVRTLYYHYGDELDSEIFCKPAFFVELLPNGEFAPGKRRADELRRRLGGTGRPFSQSQCE